MIIEAILGILFDMIRWMMDFLPVINIPLDVVGSIAGLVELVTLSTFFLPIGMIQLSIIVWLSVNNAQSIKQAIDWVLRKIPSIS